MSVIVPAFNEAGYITATLERLRAAEQRLRAESHAEVQIVVVDNASTDRTADLAANTGATVVHEAEHNIARVRNTGAASAVHGVVVFVDADTLVPPELLSRIARAMADPTCAGGAVDFVHRVPSLVLRAYFGAWRLIGLLCGTAQGACQFCRKDLFLELRGYDETWYMGEDLDFFWRLKRMARRRGLSTAFIKGLPVVPSPRRWNTWPLWRTLIWTNPLFALAFRRRKAAWASWYDRPPR